MENNIKSTGANNFTLRLMASYSLILFLILCLGICLYSVSTENIKKEIRNQNQTLLKNSINQFDTDLIFMATLTRQIAGSSDLVRLANITSPDDSRFYMLAYETKLWLSTFVPSHMLLPVESYFIRLRNTDYMLSFDRFEDLPHYYAQKRLLNPELYASWKSLMEDPSKNYQFLPISDFCSSYTGYPTNYFYIMSLEDFSFRTIPADICFEINTNKVNQIFSSLNLHDTGYILAVDSQNIPMFTISNGSLESSETGGMLELLRNLSYDSSGLSSYSDSGQTMLVTAVKSQYNHWTYYLAQPAGKTFYSIGSYQLIFFLFVAAAIAMGAVLIFFLSRRNSRPMVIMNGELSRSREKERELLELAKQQEPFLKASYLRRLVNGIISSEDELDYVRGYLGLPAPNQAFYQVLYCTLYANEYEINTEDTYLVKIASCDYDSEIRDALHKHFNIPFLMFSPQERSYAVMLYPSSGLTVEQINHEAALSFSRLHDELLKNHSIWLSGSLGSAVSTLPLVWKSYRQAQEAIRYTAREHFLCSYSDLTQDSQVYYFPPELAQQLAGFIESGNTVQLAEVFRLLKKENLSKRSLSVRQMEWLLSDIRNTLFKVRFSMPSRDADAGVLERIDRGFEDQPSFKLYEDLALELGRLMQADMPDNQLISRIKAYIESAYMDPSLCLSKISEEFSISESYFSYLFKKTTGENFSGYLEHIRMSRAMELLKNTDTKISDLYLELGYNNITSFRRVFKKTYGVSPNAVRTAGGSSGREV